ncbi:hypothetical protein MMC22_002861 [Lobaria immixta]|nr:hypothetical protein [Lobaria immixta]
MAKAKSIQTKKEKGANATYRSVFGQVLTPTQAAVTWKEALEKEELAKAKKLTFHDCKTASAEKKKAMKEAKQQRLQACLAKKRQKEKQQRIKAFIPRSRQQYGKNTQ